MRKKKGNLKKKKVEKQFFSLTILLAVLLNCLCNLTLFSSPSFQLLFLDELEPEYQHFFYIILFPTSWNIAGLLFFFSIFAFLSSLCLGKLII